MLFDCKTRGEDIYGLELPLEIVTTPSISESSSKTRPAEIKCNCDEIQTGKSEHAQIRIRRKDRFWFEEGRKGED